jgi:hypothetical protein
LLSRRKESASDFDRDAANLLLPMFRTELPPPGAQSWRIGKYAIRDEDVDVFDAVLSAAPTAAAAAIAVPTEAYKANVAVVVAATVAAFKLVSSILRNHAELSQSERVLLAALKLNGGSMPDNALASSLAQNCPDHFADEAAVHACLVSLSKKAVKSREVKAFVTLDGENVWRLAV